MRILGRFLVWVGLLRPAIVCHQCGNNSLTRYTPTIFRCDHCHLWWEYPAGRWD